MHRILLLAVVALSPALFATEDIVMIPTRPGVTTVSAGVLIVAAGAAAAAEGVLVGSEGVLTVALGATATAAAGATAQCSEIMFSSGDG